MLIITLRILSVIVGMVVRTSWAVAISIRLISYDEIYTENSVCNSGDSCLDLRGCSYTLLVKHLMLKNTERNLSVLVGIVVWTLWVVAISIG